MVRVRVDCLCSASVSTSPTNGSDCSPIPHFMLLGVAARDPRLNIAHLPFNVVRMADLEAKDPRVYFAAERTFLAWIRTGLALMGFGFVVARFGLFLHEMAALGNHPALKSYGFSVWAGTALVLMGVFVNLATALRHVQIINGLNEGADVVGRPSYIAVAVAIILALGGVAMVVFLLAVD